MGREGPLEVLAAALAAARAGRRQVVLVQGEPGIGKTTLVEAFLERLRGDPALLVATGACVEAFGAGEPYRPVLEALMRLGRAADAAPIRALLRRCAPTGWPTCRRCRPGARCVRSNGG